MAGRTSTSYEFIFGIMYAVIGLGLGGTVQVVLKSYCPQLPYTVIIFFLGLGISLAIEFWNAARSDNISTEATGLLDSPKIGSDVIIYAFLPILIFGECMNLNWHHVLSGLSQSILLAGPGAVVGCVLMGLMSKAFLPWMSWDVAFMFGAILSATDPVAVISLLKSSGASHSLTLLIVGESLLNDGSAMVLFSLFYGLTLRTTSPTAVNILIFFLKDAFGSVAFGILIGLATNRLMRYLDDPIKGTDMNLQILVTIVATYTSFIIAQATFEVSGVLSSSAAGLILAWLAPPFILQHEVMHAAWASLEWICNTLIFFYAGLASGYAIKTNGELYDFYNVFVLYLFLLVIRAFIMCVLYPFLKRGGLACSIQDAVFMTWAGLRGALGIALALVVQDYYEDHSGHCDNSANQSDNLCRSKFFIYIVGIAACTLLINATTANWVLKKLGLVLDKEVSFEKRMVLDRIRRNFRRKMRVSCEEELGKNFGGAEPRELVKLCTLLADGYDVEQGGSGSNDPSDSSTADRGDKINSRDFSLSSALLEGDIMEPRQSALNELITENRLSDYRDDPVNIQGCQTDLMDYARSSFLRQLRVIYTEAVFTGKIGRASYAPQALMNSIDVAEDFTNSKLFGLHDYDALIKVVDLKSFVINAASKIDYLLSNLNINSNFNAYLVAQRDRRIVYALTSFIFAHETAQKQIHVIFGGNKNETDAMESIPELEQLKWESSVEVDYAKQRLAAYRPETLKRFYLQRAARIILFKQSHLLSEMVQDGTLSEKDSQQFQDIINADHIHVNEQRELLNKDFVRERRDELVSDSNKRQITQRSIVKKNTEESQRSPSDNVEIRNSISNHPVTSPTTPTENPLFAAMSNNSHDAIRDKNTNV